MKTATATATKTATAKTGDHVQLSDGEYAGCILTLLRRDRFGAYVCKRSSWPYEVKAQAVTVYRAMPKGGF